MKNDSRAFILLLFIPIMLISGCIGQTPEQPGNATEPQDNTTISDICANVTCEPTELLCDDGFKASCQNRCIDGVCTTCNPDCSDHEVQSCQEQWTCTEWTECNNNTSTRSCTDSNSCGTTESRPTETSACGSETPLHLLITDVYYDTVGDDSLQEWIEINNPTPANISLDGFYLLDNSNQRYAWYFPNGSMIEPGYPMVIAKSSTGHKQLFGCIPEFFGFTFQLNNDADEVGLYRDGQIIDKVSWGGQNGWNITSGNDKSLERKVTNVDTDSVDDWVVEEVPRPGRCFFSD